MPDAPLSLYEHEEISVGLIENPEMSWSGLARQVGRHPTTIAREVTRNGGRGRYRLATAEQRGAEARRRCRPCPGSDDQGCRNQSWKTPGC